MRGNRHRIVGSALALTVVLLSGAAASAAHRGPTAPSVQTLDQGAGPVAMAAAAQGDDPAAVVAAAQAARSGEDAAAAAAFFTDNAIWVRTVATGPCSRQSPCLGRAAILPQFQVEAAIRQCITVVEQAVHGNVVVSRFEVRSDNLRRNGIERTVTISMALVDQGKIVAQFNFSDLSDAQTAANAAIGAGRQAPGAPLPNPPTRCG